MPLSTIQLDRLPPQGTSGGSRDKAVRSRTGVLFLNSSESIGADTFIHLMLMRHLDRAVFDVHVANAAGAAGGRPPSYQAAAAIPDLHVRPTNFGPSLTGRSKLQKLAGLLGGPPLLAEIWALARYVRRHRIRVLHSTDRPRDAVTCVLLGRLTGAKSIVHVHVKCADWMGRPVLAAFARADALVGVSQFVARSLAANGFQPSTTHVVANAIDAADWNDRLDPAPIRREFELPVDAPVVACVARLFHWKGQADLIRTVALMRQDFPTLRLLVVGEDDRMAMRESYTSELRALVRDLGLERQVIFTGRRSDIPALLAAADVFALPSFEEPFGLVFLEALAMKKPVVALDNGGTPEVVEHGRTGLLSAPGDLAALAGNLSYLLKNPEVRARMGEYGRQQVETRFTPARMSSQAGAVYLRVCSTGRRSRSAPAVA